MDDNDILSRINALASEEHELLRKESDGVASDGDRQRMARIEVMLDQCWDFLRQRRARRAAGLDPDEAEVRPESTVERYTG